MKKPKTLKKWHKPKCEELDIGQTKVGGRDGPDNLMQGDS